MFVKISAGLMAAILLVLFGMMYEILHSTHVDVQWSGGMSLGSVVTSISTNLPVTADTSNGIALDDAPKPVRKPKVTR